MIELESVKADAFGRLVPAKMAKATGNSVSTLANWRTLGIGPKWIKVNGRVYYPIEAAMAWASGEDQAAA